MGDHRQLTVVGAGRAGSAVAVALARKGWDVHLVCRRRERRERLQRWGRDNGIAWQVIDKAGPGAAGVLFATADRDLRATATALAEMGESTGPWLHLSGVAPPSLIRVEGGPAAVGSTHPLAAILDPFAAGGAPEHVVAPLVGAFWAVDGDVAAIPLANAIALACGGTPHAVAAEHRADYHAAASVVANDFVALLSIAERRARAAGLDTQTARKALLHLAFTAVRAVSIASVGDGKELADGLTGAVGRGDAGTILAHLNAMADSPADAMAHRLLSKLLLTEVGDRLSDAARAAMDDVLSSAPSPPKPRKDGP